MKSVVPTRSRSVRQLALPPARKTVHAMHEPGAFQCALLRAFQLPQAYREVYLLKDIQGLGLTEIAAILGISVGTVVARLKWARLEVDSTGNSGAMERVS